MMRAGHRTGWLLLLALCVLPPWRVAPAQQAADVPYVSTPSNVVAAMLEMARVTTGDYLIDLGSGDGRIVIEAAKKNGARGLGVELDANLVSMANQAARRQSVAGQVTFVQGSLFDADLSRTTVLTMYLLPSINLQLRPRILGQLRPGTRVVSHDFDMGAWKPDLHREVAVPDKSYGAPVSQIYLWYVPANVAGKWQWRLPVGGTTRLYEARIDQRFQELSGETRVDGGTATGQGARLRGDLVTLNLVREFSGQKFTHEFSGRVEGDRIVGRARISGGSGNATLDWEATRVERGRMTIE
ncbi:MAG: class I SAM-dependent methyltransferase [Betaproteobacteria bacterium]|nr:class I SAM-dependent methyltransferase [Betaproteobacteria bacterium]